MQHYIVFNIYPVGPNLYLPNVFIVKESVAGGPGYIEQKATKETLPSFELEISNELMRLINSVNEINASEIANRFNPNKKKLLSIEQLIESDPKGFGTMKKFIWKKLSDVIAAVVRQEQMLTLNLPRKDEAGRHMLKPHVKEIEPQLSFKLKDYGIIYELRVLESGERIKVWEKNLVVLSNEPAWVIISGVLYHVPHIKGLMLKPFTAKEHIFIPPKSIISYFQNFILKVATKVDITAEGFDMTEQSELQKCRLEIVKDLFTDEWVLLPVMMYNGGVEFPWNDVKHHRLSLNTESENIKIVKVERQSVKESEYVNKLDKLALSPNATGNFFLKGKALTNSLLLHEWVINNKEDLLAEGFVLQDLGVEEAKIYAHKPTLDFTVTEENDWFDVKAVVRVGTFQIPFSAFIPFIKNRETLYELPNGEFMIIPEEWLSKYEQFSKFAEVKKDQIRFAKSQYTILEETGLLKTKVDDIDQKDLLEIIQPNLKATLRPYQLEGVQWMATLNQSGLGGCLADDMGLGKTLQTISILLYAKDQKTRKLAPELELVEDPLSGSATVAQTDLFSSDPEAEKPLPLRSLVVLPASLVFNWYNEIQKFAPSLTVLTHTGTKRDKEIDQIASYDVILTTYHTALRDFDVLKQIHWEYIVLDESQQIKNKDGKVFRSISKLEANHKLALSGTPIENSLSDLWAQMQFINPNLLGGYTFFRNEFKTPIERKGDEGKKTALYNLVKPYLLRRTKGQVAKDLPDLTTKIFYSEMEKSQAKWYEAEKSMVRNYILNVFDRKKGKDQVHMLQSLMKLRQLANHTSMAGYEPHEGGKFSDVINHWKTVTKSGHKVLIFSSFVMHLELYRDYFESEGIPFSFLHGGLTAAKKKKEIEKFENDPVNRTFLISIKAGGTGLNLTSADYVFILDPWWNPFVEKQAIARAHRIGQDKNVVAIKFVTKNTIEEKIIKLQNRKTALAQDIIKDDEKLTLSDDILKELID